VRTTTSLIISDSFFFHLPFRDCRMLPATDAVAAVVAPLENPRRRGLVANRTATREFHFPLCLLLLCASHFSFSIIACRLNEKNRVKRAAEHPCRGALLSIPIRGIIESRT